jgi:protein MpaA
MSMMRVSKIAVQVLFIGLLLAESPYFSLRYKLTGKAQAATANHLSEKKIVFGNSVKGRHLVAYVLGNGSNVTMIFGAFHGNEPATPVVVEKLLTYLRKNPGQWPDCRVVLAPCVNPDGLHNRTRTNAHHVDINRNFPGTWRRQAARQRYNPGPSPASEPETKAVIHLINAYRPQKIISLHQPLHTMIYTGRNSREMALLMRKFNRYAITTDVGYPTPGAFGDYCGKQKGIAIVTLELPSESANAAWNHNKKALLAAIKTSLP